MVITEKDIDAAALRALSGGNTDIEVGRLHLAAWAHHCVGMTAMYYNGVQIDFTYDGVRMRAGVDVNPREQVCIQTFDDDGYVFHEYTLTRSNFFCFLNSIPNVYAFVEPTSLDGRELGVSLLKRYAEAD